MKKFIEHYGMAVVAAIVVVVYIVMASPVGAGIKEGLSSIITGITGVGNSAHIHNLLDDEDNFKEIATITPANVVGIQANAVGDTLVAVSTEIKFKSNKNYRIVVTMNGTTTKAFEGPANIWADMDLGQMEAIGYSTETPADGSAVVVHNPTCSIGYFNSSIIEYYLPGIDVKGVITLHNFTGEIPSDTVVKIYESK